ncbi:MAG: hypothetical protein KDK90_12045 [Leptospiraceae bacterium]|nr:hypothetical protein [Leptospiraceae bacterium]
MKFLNYFSIIFVSILLFSVCKSGDEELASFTNGKIIRSELQNFYKLKNIEADPKTASIKNQISIIENLSLLKIIESQNEKEGLFKSKEFQSLFDLYKNFIVADLYRKSFFEKIKKSKDVELVVAQVIQVGLNSDSAETDPKVIKIWNDLTSLKEDQKIYDYIVANTEELGSKPIGGFLDPQCINCGQNPVIDILSEGIKNKDEKFHKFVSQKSVFIYRITEMKKIKPTAIKDYFIMKLKQYQKYALKFAENAKTDEEKSLANYYAEEDKKVEYKSSKYAEFITNKFLQVAWNEEVNRIQKDYNIQISPLFNQKQEEFKEANFSDDTVLLSSPKKKYTYGELKNHYDLIKNFKNNSKDKGDEFTQRINFFLNEYLMAAIIGETEQASKILDSDEFKMNSVYLKREISFSTFIRKIQNKDIEASEEEILQTYEAGKLYSYTMDDPKDSKKKITLPLGEVKEKIRSEIKSTKFKKLLEKDIENLKKSNNLKIYTEKLKEGSL